MATIIVVTRGLPSLVYPAIELARRLAAAGHRVSIGGDPAARGLADAHRLDFLSLEPDGYEAYLRADARAPLARRLLGVRRRRAEARASLAVDRLADSLRGARPDLVLINGEMHAHIISAVGGGLPVALLNTFVSLWRAPRIPPPHHRGIPGEGWRGSRAGAALLWTSLAARQWRRRWSQRIRHAGCDRAAILRDLAVRQRFDFSRHVDWRQWLIPFTYRTLPVLSLHAREFEFPHDPPPYVHYVGPMILADRPDRRLDPAERARFDAVLARHRRAGPGSALIYAGFGSVFSAGRDLIRRLIAAVEGRPSWTLVVSLSERASAADFGPVPQGVELFSWVPQLEALAAADVAVTHGGINSVDECVMSGVPMLVYCGGETDMAGTTSRVVYHGLGVSGEARSDGPTEIQRHIDRLLGDTAYRDRLAAMRRRYMAYESGQVAERTVATLLARDVAAAGSGARR